MDSVLRLSVGKFDAKSKDERRANESKSDAIEQDKNANTVREHRPVNRISLVFETAGNSKLCGSEGPRNEPRNGDLITHACSRTVTFAHLRASYSHGSVRGRAIKRWY